MSVPRQRLASRRGRTRASHHALKPITIGKCSNCQKPVLPHRACPACGFYDGRNVFAKDTKATAKPTTPPSETPASQAMPPATPAIPSTTTTGPDKLT